MMTKDRLRQLTGDERLGQMRESEYLGAEDIDDGVEPVLTIAGLWYGSVTLQRGKENKDVLSFTEERVPGVMQVRPLIVNSTNRKTLRKLFGDAKASTLVGKQIQLFVDHNVRDPQDGGMTDGIRIRPYKPRVQKQEPVPPCTDCGQEITPAMGKDARWLAGYIDGVGAVQVYPVWNGAGTVKCSVMGADYLPASTTLVNNVQNAIDPEPNQGLGLGLAPIGSQVTITSPTKVTVNISAAVTLATGYTLDQVTPIVKASLEAYLLSVRKSWGEQLGTTEVKYAANVYISRILASIVSTTGIVNAVNVQLNGQASDLILIESGSVQQVPVLGEVTLSA